MTNEKLADKVKRLSRELELAKGQMASCPHQFSDPIRATREISVSVFDHYEPHGSDPEPIFNWHKKTEYEWEKKCNLCNYVVYTAKTKPIEYGPDFGGQQT